MISIDELKKLVVYDGRVGRFFWISKSGKGIKKSKNGEVGSYDSHGYRQVRILGNLYKEHQLVWFYVYGEWANNQLDHINHKRDDNRIENLRLSSFEENAKNRPMQKNNKTGHVGVYLSKRTKKYQSYITSNGKRLNLGSFSDIQNAIEARANAEKEHGFHINHGIGFGVTKHKPNRFKTYDDFQKYRTEQRRRTKEIHG